MNPHMCQWAECPNKIFDSPESLTLHILNEHFDHQAGGGASKAYICQWRHCTRKGELSTRTNFITHLRSHTGERPYKCTVCQQTFTRSEALTKHTKNQHPDVYQAEQELKQQQGSVKAPKSTTAAHQNSAIIMDYRKACQLLHLKMRYLYAEQQDLQEQLHQVTRKTTRLRTMRTILLDEIQKETGHVHNDDEVYFSDESQQ